MAKKDYKKLVIMEKYPGYYVNPASGKITWRGNIKNTPQKCHTGKTKITDARKVVGDFILSLTADNIERAQREKKGITNPAIESLWHETINERKASKAESTLIKYDVSWRIKIKPFWGEKNLSDISQRSVIEFENWYLEKFPTQTFFNVGKHFQMFLNYLHREGYIPKHISVNDLDKVLAAKTQKVKAFRVYSQDEQDSLISSAVTPRAKALIMGYLDTGARKMELISRKWSELDCEKGTLKVWSMKNKKWREIPLTQRFLHELKFWSRFTADSEFIFPMLTDRSNHISSQLFDREWVATKKAAGIKGKARVHDMRHTFATATAKAGWPIPIACTHLDMSADEYMKTYTHIKHEDISPWLIKTFEKGCV